MNKTLINKVIKATKWSVISEITYKLIHPITSMILARLLAPEAFGVVATVFMVISFADMFTDAGFQKYIIQHDFHNDLEKDNHTNVAFWTNLAVSMLLWVLLLIFRNPIASLVGNPGLGDCIAVAGITLPLTSFSSIQVSLYRREFNFKTLFEVRLVEVFVPIIVTIPLVFLGFNYWALIIGTIIGKFSNAFLLTLKSSWKPKLFYKIYILKEMLSFSIWSLIVNISVWLSSWIDIFIVGSVLNDYSLGLYKTSINIVNSFMEIISAAASPVLLSALSRLYANQEEYNKVFYLFQSLFAALVLPMGVGLFLYRDLATDILLGSQWEQASLLIGLWGLISSIIMAFTRFSSTVYISKGKPLVSFLSQVLNLIVLVPALMISVKHSFTTLIYVRSLVRLVSILVNFILMFFIMKMSPWKMIKNVFPSIICSLAMGAFAVLLQYISSSLLWSVFSILLCTLFYFANLMKFPRMHKEIFNVLKKVKLK